MGGTDAQSADGKVHAIANGHLSYEIFTAKSEFLFKLVSIVERTWGFSASLPVLGPGEIFIDCWQGGTRLSCGWDNWSGCFVMAHDDAGDLVIQQIAHEMQSLTLQPGEYEDW